MKTERRVYLTYRDTLSLSGPAEIKFVRNESSVAVVDVQCDGMVSVDEFDPVADDVRQPARLDDFFWQAFCAVAAEVT